MSGPHHCPHEDRGGLGGQLRSAPAGSTGAVQQARGRPRRALVLTLCRADCHPPSSRGAILELHTQVRTGTK